MAESYLVLSVAAIAEPIPGSIRSAMRHQVRDACEGPAIKSLSTLEDPSEDSAHETSNPAFAQYANVLQPLR